MRVRKVFSRRNRDKKEEIRKKIRGRIVIGRQPSECGTLQFLPRTLLYLRQQATMSN